MVETPGAALIRDSWKLLTGDMGGIILTQKTIKDLKALAEKLHYPEDDVPSALDLSEQLGLLQLGITVS